MWKKGIMGILVLVVLTLALGSIACDGDQVYNSTARSLQTARETWHGLQDQAAEMRKGGRLTDAQWATWVEIDAKYRASHNAAVEALKVYQVAKDKPAQDALFAAMGELSGIIQRAGDLIAAWKKE